ncbi:MAG: hypothetical protein EOO56_09810 [Hymenobacter sp.]|nr:MAG: hypothetical protein EOO56_09810 [Hymenobacter sp.]
MPATSPTHRDELLAEITRAFQDVPQPDEDLSGLAWPDLSDDFLREQLPFLASPSPAGFRYYMPAFLGFALREPIAQRLASLLALLKLPTELSGPAVTELLSYFEAASPPPVAVSSLMQQLTQANQALNLFVARASQLTPLPAKAIYHFLIYLQDAGTAAQQQEAAVAIARYWF